MLVLYLGILIAALWWVAKVLLPEMAKPPIPKNVTKYIPQKFVTNTPKPQAVAAKEPHETDRRIEKLEMLLAEKNKNINILQTELKVFQVQVNAFDKVKTLFEEEIGRLREQNRIFRSELGISNTAAKENSLT